MFEAGVGVLQLQPVLLFLFLCIETFLSFYVALIILELAMYVAQGVSLD